MLYPSCWMADYPAKKLFHLQLEFLLGRAISEVTESVPANFDRKWRRPTTYVTSATLRGDYKVGVWALIRFLFSGRIFVIEMTIKLKVGLGKYKITHESPTTQKSCCDWVLIKDMSVWTADDFFERMARPLERLKILACTKTRNNETKWPNWSLFKLLLLFLTWRLR